MAQVHAINGTTVEYIGQPDWIDKPLGGYLAGPTTHDRYRDHIWRTNIMTAAEFDTIFALMGQQVSITTTDYNDRDGDYKTYYNVVLESVDGTHEGPNFTGVECKFSRVLV